MKKLMLTAFLLCGAARADWRIDSVVVHLETGDTVATIHNNRLHPSEGMDTIRPGVWFDGRVDDAFDDGVYFTCDSNMLILNTETY